MLGLGLLMAMSVNVLATESPGISSNDADMFTPLSLERHLISEFGEEFLNNLEESRSIADEIWSNFPINRSTGEHIVPEYIAGDYFDEDGNLVIQLVENAIIPRNMEAVIFNENVIIKYASYSRTYLHSLSALIVNKYFENQSAGIRTNFGVTYLDTINNRIVVELETLNEDEIQHFRDTVSESTAILFVEGETVWPS